MSNYQILSASNKKTLEALVNDSLSGGYHLAGGVFIEYSENDIFQYHQAVYKPSD